MAEILSHGKAFCGSVVDEQHRVSRCGSPGQIGAIRSFLPMKKVCRSGGSSCSSSASGFHGVKLGLDPSVNQIQSAKSSGPKVCFFPFLIEIWLYFSSRL